MQLLALPPPSTPPELAALARQVWREAAASQRHGADWALLAAEAAEEVATEAEAAGLPMVALRWRLAAASWRSLAPIFAAP